MAQRSPAVLLVGGRAGSGRSSALRAAVGDGRLGGEVAAEAVHLPVRGARSQEAAAVASAWVAEIVRWTARHGSASQYAAVAAAIEDALRDGLDGRRLPSDLVTLLPVRTRSRWIAASGRRDRTRSPQLVTVAVDLLVQLAAAVPLVLAADEVDRLDATSVEVIRQLAERVAEDPALRVLLVVANPTADLLADVPADRVTTVELGDEDQLAALLARCRVPDPRVRARLVEIGATAAVAAIAYLQHLRLSGLLTLDPADGWHLTDPAADRPAPELPSLDAAFDATIDRCVLPTWQKVIGVGAVMGTTFPLAAAIEVAQGEAPTPEQVHACAEQLRVGDPDEVVLRCTTVDGREHVTFSSSVWLDRLRDRLLRAERRQPAGALGRVLTKDARTFDDWFVAARLFDQADDPASAGDAFLRAARAARLGLSDESAARAYAAAAQQLWESVQRERSTPSRTARGLVRIAYCSYRSANLLASAAADARSRAAAERLGRACEARLDDADEALDAAREVLADWRTAPPNLPDLDQLVMDELDVQSEDEVRVAMQLDTLTAYVHLQRGRNALVGATPDHERAAEHLLLAMRFGASGLSGLLHRELIVRASAGLSTAMAVRAIGARTEEERRWSARAALLHGSRALVVRDVIGGRSSDDQGARALDESVAFVLRNRRVLAELLRLPDLARHVRHRARREGVPASLLEAGLDDGCAGTVFGAGPAPAATAPAGSRTAADGAAHDAGDDEEALPAALVVDLARGACPPSRIAHAEAVERYALDLLAAVGRSLGLADGTVADDVRIAAYAHDLFRDVDGSWLLAMCSDVDHPIDALAWDHPVLLHGAVAAVVLARDLGLDRSLGDRWSRVRLAVSSHTVGVDVSRASDLRGDAAFAAVLHLADARAKAEEDGGRPATTEDWWARALAGDLAGAYEAVLARRAERVLAEGRVVAAVTRRAMATDAASPPIDLRDAVTS